MGKLDDLKNLASSALNGAGEALGNGVKWCRDNPVAAAAGLVVLKRAISAKKQHDDQERRNRLIWDPSAGHHWEVRRKLTQAEWLDVQRLQRQGLSIGEALNRMNLLKK